MQDLRFKKQNYPRSRLKTQNYARSTLKNVKLGKILA